MPLPPQKSFRVRNHGMRLLLNTSDQMIIAQSNSKGMVLFLGVGFTNILKKTKRFIICILAEEKIG